MRNAMEVADAAKRFGRIGFDPISLRSENRLRIGLGSHEVVSPVYVRPSVNIMRVNAELEGLRDARNTRLAIAQIM